VNAQSLVLSALLTSLTLLQPGRASSAVWQTQPEAQPPGAVAQNATPRAPTNADIPPARAAQFSSQDQGLGPEYQLSTPSNPETDRYYPAAAYNTQHHQTLMVWHRHGGGAYYIEGRLLGANGKPLGIGPTVLVSGQTPVYQPAVAYNAAYDQYLVVWMRNTSLDGKTYAVWGKVLSANLAEVRSEYLIFNPPANYACWTPRVAWNAGHNEYMVVWNAYDISGWPYTSPDNISQRSLYENGDLINPVILVIGNTPGKMIFPDKVDLVYANDGGTNNWGQYLWVWQQVKPGTADHDIWGANIDAYLGGYIPGLPPFPIDTSTVEQTAPRIATNGANDFLVVWQERHPNPPNDWDVRGRELNQIGTLFGDLHIIAGEGSTDETDPFVVGWPGGTPHYAVGYARQSLTGQDIWLAYDNNDANVLHYAGYAFWLDYFPVAAYGFWTNSYPAGVVAGAGVQMAYEGVSNTLGDHPHIYSRMWVPVLVYVPVVRR
jgi:hypothetical protein